MFNQHLLQIKLSVPSYKKLIQNRATLKSSSQLPQYTIAHCPLCHANNEENINTYSLHGWSRRPGDAVFSKQLIQHHCPHFVIVEPFIHFHGLWPQAARGLLGPEQPCVKAHLLDKQQAVAVIHTLPLCRIENNHFIPRYTLFMVTYFAANPQTAQEEITTHNLQHTDEPYIPSPFLGGCQEDRGDDLSYWVAKGQLFWLDTPPPIFTLQTNDTASFPYKGIKGRTFAHRFPYPLP